MIPLRFRTSQECPSYLSKDQVVSAGIPYFSIRLGKIELRFSTAPQPSLWKYIQLRLVDFLGVRKNMELSS